MIRIESIPADFGVMRIHIVPSATSIALMSTLADAITLIIAWKLIAAMRLSLFTKPGATYFA